MNFLTFILQTAPGAAAQGAADGQPGAMGGGAMTWVMLILIFVVMWLFMIRPQRKQQKEAEMFRNSLKKGDKVVTAGGIYGIISEVQDNAVLLKVDGEVKLKVDKNSIVKDPAEAAAPSNK